SSVGQRLSRAVGPQRAARQAERGVGRRADAVAPSVGGAVGRGQAGLSVAGRGAEREPVTATLIPKRRLGAWRNVVPFGRDGERGPQRQRSLQECVRFYLALDR